MIAFIERVYRSYLRRKRILDTPAEIRFRPSQWPEILEKFGGACAYCGAHQSTLPYPLESDHVFPLCRGGYLTASNIVPSCQPCNRAKAAFTVEELGWKDPRAVAY